MKKFLCLLLCLVVSRPGAWAGDTVVQNLSPVGDTTKLVAAIENYRSFPVFVIPLGGTFYDYEIKGTQTNFNQAGSGVEMVYFYASAFDRHPELTSIWDGSPKIFYTGGSIGADPRRWLTANPSVSLYSQVGSVTTARIGEVCHIPNKIAGSAAWMYKGNKNLVWSYSRIGPTGPERDGSGNVLWHLIIPAEWRLEQIAP